MKVIYSPKGKAREYADLALNIYKGCTHACRYCYCGTFPWTKDYFKDPNPKQDLIQNLEHDCKILSQLHSVSVPEILISFMGDPYQPAEMELGLTRQAIETLIKHDLPFTILTKGGRRACRDFDLLKSYGYDKCSFGTSLSFFCDDGNVSDWEPGAATVRDRIRAIETAYAFGIRTWVSLEPVIYPKHALQIIHKLWPVVNYWKIGKLNHFPEIEKYVDWPRFKADVTALLESLGAAYYIKNSLRGM